MHMRAEDRKSLRYSPQDKQIQ